MNVVCLPLVLFSLSKGLTTLFFFKNYSLFFFFFPFSYILPSKIFKFWILNSPLVSLRSATISGGPRPINKSASRCYTLVFRVCWLCPLYASLQLSWLGLDKDGCNWRTKLFKMDCSFTGPTDGVCVNY